MPKFFFHVHDGKDIPDEDGIELADLEAAKREAVVFSGAVLMDTAKTFWDGEEWELLVTDERGLTLFTLTFTGLMSAAATR